MIAAIIGSVLFIIVIILYILLIAGAPLGEYAMGGKYKILPPKVRILALLAVLIQIFGIILLLQSADIIHALLASGIIKTACYIYAFYFSLNILMNLLSKSKKERLVMTPLSAIASICFWIIIFRT